jgi:hypothetical protein
MCFKQMRNVFVCNVAAGGAKYVAYKQNLHSTSLYA